MGAGGGGGRFKLPPAKLLGITCLASWLAMAGEAYQSILNQPAGILRTWLNGSFHDHYGVVLGGTGLDTLWGALVASLDLGAVIGSLLIGVAAESLGRRNAVLILNPLIMIASAGAQFLAYYADAFELLILGRFLIGANLALAVAIICVFICESVPTYCRGLLGSIPAFFYAFWVMVGTLLSLDNVLGTPTSWQYLLGFGVIPAVLSICLCPFLHESPKHLFISQRNRPAALRSLAFYYCTEDEEVLERVLEEFEEEERLGEKAGELGLLEIFREPHLRRAFWVAIVTVVAIDFAGIDVAMAYSSSVMKSLGLPPNLSDYGTILTQIPGLVFCLLCVLIIEHTGRRTLLYVTLACGVLGNVFFVLADQVPSLALPALILVYANHHGGLAPIANIVTGEICPQSIRSTTSAAAWTLNWAVSTVIVLVFPPLQSVAGSYTYTIFVVTSALILIWEAIYFPETRNRAVNEISSAWLVPSEKTPLLSLDEGGRIGLA